MTRGVSVRDVLASGGWVAPDRPLTIADDLAALRAKPRRVLRVGDRARVTATEEALDAYCASTVRHGANGYAPGEVFVVTRAPDHGEWVAKGPVCITSDMCVMVEGRERPRRERTPQEVDVLGRRLHAHYTRMMHQERAPEDVWPESVTGAQRAHWCDVAVLMDDDSRRDCAYEILESVTKETSR